MTPIKSISSLQTKYPPCTIQFSPLLPTIALIGTYQLDNADQGEEQQQHKHGSIDILRLVGDNYDTIEINESIELDHGVCDIHFHPTTQNLFASSNSNQTVMVSVLEEPQAGQPRVKILAIYSLSWPKEGNDNKKEVLETCTWHPVNRDILAVGATDGTILLLRLNITEVLATSSSTVLRSDAEVQVITKHEYQAWTVAFSPSGGSLFSGGDDAVLHHARISSSSTDNNEEEPDVRSFTRLHDAGVTAILALSDRTIITGSYDESIRVITPFSRPFVKAKKAVGGGVWRLQLIDSSVDERWKESEGEVSFGILASCHSGGCQVVRVTRGEAANWKVEVMLRFTEHQSMNYASDILPLGSLNAGEGERTMISTSFYDRLVCLWRTMI